MSQTERSTPPPDWCDWWTGITRVTDELYYGWPNDDPSDHPWFWHWCTEYGKWRGAGTHGHDLISREPLHLEPSLLWVCCGMHGWLRENAWIPA